MELGFKKNKEEQAARIRAMYNQPANEDITKGGEGSRGGRVIGHTKSGKAIYADDNAKSYKNFTQADHKDAEFWHKQASYKLGAKKGGETAAYEHNKKAFEHSKEAATAPFEYDGDSDSKNPNLAFQGIDSEVLSKMVSGNIDPRIMAHKELANRGLDLNGFWVGFDKAKELHGAAIAKLK